MKSSEAGHFSPTSNEKFLFCSSDHGWPLHGQFCFVLRLLPWHLSAKLSTTDLQAPVARVQAVCWHVVWSAASILWLRRRLLRADLSQLHILRDQFYFWLDQHSSDSSMLYLMIEMLLIFAVIYTPCCCCRSIYNRSPQFGWAGDGQAC